MTYVFSVVLLSCLLQQPSAVQNENAQARLALQARIEYWSGHFARAEALFLSTLRDLGPDDEAFRAQTLAELGNVYVNEDELPKAERTYRESLAIYTKLRDQKNTALSLRDIGAIYSLQRRDGEAISVLQRALKQASTIQPPNRALTGHILNSLGTAYFRKGDLKKAEELFNRAMEDLPNNDGFYGKADLLNNLGAIYHIKRQYAKSEEYLTRALSIVEQQVGPRHPDLTFTLNSLAVLYSSTGQYEKAEQQFLRALGILGDDPVFETRAAKIMQGLSRAYVAAGRTHDAEETLSKAGAIARRNVAEHPEMLVIMDAYASVLTKGGKRREGEEVRAEARRVRLANELVVSARSPVPF